MNVAEFLLEIIKALGTDTAFCLTGGMAMHINRAAAESTLQVIYCHHEQAVVAAADGYAKALHYNIPGLAIVTSGPGVTNTITAAASAYYDSVPLYILSGQVKTADINRFGVRSYGAQEVPQIKLMENITKCAFRYTDEIDDDCLAMNLAQAMTDRKGPVFIEIPLDIQPLPVLNGPIRVTAIVAQIQHLVQKGQSIASSNVELIVEALTQAKRPVFVIGNGFRIAGGTRRELKSLLEKLAIPTLFTWASFDLLEFEHSLNYGCAGGLAPTHANRALQAADTIVFMGVRLDLLTTAFCPDNYGSNAKRYIVELDAHEIEKNSGIKNAVFIGENVTGILHGLLAQQRWIEADSAWIDQCEVWRASDRLKESRAFEQQCLNTYQMARVLSRSVISSYVVATASGYAIESIVRFFRPNIHSTLSLAGHCLGSMGLSLPSAVGAAAALKIPVICLEGDGGLLLNVQELLTIKANPTLLLTIIVMNNGGYQSIARSQKKHIW